MQLRNNNKDFFTVKSVLEMKELVTLHYFAFTQV